MSWNKAGRAWRRKEAYQKGEQSEGFKRTEAQIGLRASLAPMPTLGSGNLLLAAPLFPSALHGGQGSLRDAVGGAAGASQLFQPVQQKVLAHLVHLIRL